VNQQVEEQSVKLTLSQIQAAFDKAEQETADHFKGQTCSMIDRDGYHACPICHFRRLVKVHLGID